MNKADQNIKPTIAVVAYSKYYTEYRDAMSSAFNTFGLSSQTYTDIKSAISCDIIIVVGIAFFSKVPFFLNKLLIGVQGEHLPLPGDKNWSLERNKKRYKAISCYFDLIVEWSPANYIYHRCPVHRKFIPFGAPIASNQNKNTEWEVLFLGNPFGGKGRRIPILNRIKKEFKLCPTMEAWGETKFQLLNSAKICLNLHQFESLSFESPRIFELLSEGVFILTEPIANSFPFEDGVHFVSFNDESDMIEKIKYYCENNEARLKIAMDGKNRADQYKQIRMFEMLSIEIDHAYKNRANELYRFYNWLKGSIGNSVIVLIDVLALLKRKAIKKLF